MHAAERHPARDRAAAGVAARLLGLLGAARGGARAALRVRPPLLRPGHRGGARALPLAVPALGAPRRAADLPDRQRGRRADPGGGRPAGAAQPALDGRAAHRRPAAARSCWSRRPRRRRSPTQHRALAESMLTRWVVGTPASAAKQVRDLASTYDVDEVMLHPVAGALAGTPADPAPAREATLAPARRRHLTCGPGRPSSPGADLRSSKGSNCSWTTVDFGAAAEAEHLAVGVRRDVAGELDLLLRRGCRAGRATARTWSRVSSEAIAPASIAASRTHAAPDRRAERRRAGPGRCRPARRARS